MLFRRDQHRRGKMIKIVNYLDCFAAAKSYDQAALAQLQSAYDRARIRLGLDHMDPRRQQVALLVFSLSEKASTAEALADLVVDAFKRV
jgi:hypothetical protein